MHWLWSSFSNSTEILTTTTTKAAHYASLTHETVSEYATVSNTVAEQDFTYENLEVANFFPNEIEQTIQTYREMLRQSLDEKFLIIGFKQNQTETGFFTKKQIFESEE